MALSSQKSWVWCPSQEKSWFGGFATLQLLLGPWLSWRCRGQVVAWIAWCTCILVGWVPWGQILVRRPCNKFGIEMMSFLNGERGISLRNRWKLVLVRSSSVVFFLLLALRKLWETNLMAFLASSMPNRDSARLILVLGLQESQYRSLTLEGRALSLESFLYRWISKLCTRPVGQPQVNTRG